MRAVVADTGPLNYLVLIDHVRILPALFQTVFVPETVWSELSHPETPRMVREWIEGQPPWLVVRNESSGRRFADFPALDDGERGALVLAQSLNAGLVLMDDRAGVAVARRLGFAVTGTLGLLERAARRGWVDLSEAFRRLRTTSFRCRPDLLDAILKSHERGS